MELGAILALISSAAYAGSQVFVRKGTYKSEESFTAVFIVLAVGILLFAFVLPLSQSWESFRQLSLRGYVLLATSGIIQFAIGRYMVYKGIRFIGANRSTAITRTYILLTVFFGVAFLGEALSATLILGALSITAGVLLVSLLKDNSTQSEQTKKEGRLSSQSKGIFLSLLYGLCLAISSMLIKIAIGEVSSPYAAVFVSYMAAFIPVFVILLSQSGLPHIFGLSNFHKITLGIAAILAFLSQVLRYAALQYSPVSIVTPILATSVLFTFFFSLMLNRKIDYFNWRVLIGIILVLAGDLLLFF